MSNREMALEGYSQPSDEMLAEFFKVKKSSARCYNIPYTNQF